MHLSLLLILLFSTNLHASIYGKDDRVDTIQAPAHLQDLARSVPALVQKNRIKALANGQFELIGNPMTKMGLCKDALFAEEANIANCSASFIGGNKILTAAHCFNEDTYKCENYHVVFDYQRSEIPMQAPHILDQSQVYNCKKIVFSEFDRTLVGIDLAIIELDREVENRTPVELNLKQTLKKNDPLVLIGYPLGISQKIVEDGKVLGVDKKNVSFKHNLDSFSVNSGSPIFSNEGIQVGVLIRGTGSNFTDREGESCYDWHVAGPKDYTEGNDLSRLIFKN